MRYVIIVVALRTIYYQLSRYLIILHQNVHAQRAHVGVRIRFWNQFNYMTLLESTFVQVAKYKLSYLVMICQSNKVERCTAIRSFFGQTEAALNKHFYYLIMIFKDSQMEHIYISVIGYINVGSCLS